MGTPIAGQQCADPLRRQFLKALATLGFVPAALAACRPEPSAARRSPRPARPFSAVFDVPGAGQVLLDFQDNANFILSADAGPGATLVVGGGIYLHVMPSLASPIARLLRIGTLKPSSSEERPDPPDLVSADLPADRLRRWGLTSQPCWVTAPAVARSTPAARFLVAKVADLAAGQHVIGTRMRDAMDMSLCGDVIGRLLATWLNAATANGLAILANDAGIELAKPIAPIARSVRLPPDLMVEDYRFTPQPVN